MPLLFALWLACAAPPPPAYGQWIWTDADARVFEASKASIPGLVPGVLVAEILVVDGAPKLTLRQRPSIVDGPRAVVVRIDDGVHALWDRDDDDALAAALDGELARLMALLRDTGVAPTEVQVDYDVPVRLLKRWSGVLAHLPALRDQPLWVTSLVAHLRDPRYGPLLRGRVRGHILQVFDTGETPTDADEVARLATQADLPWRLGIGAFERGHDGDATTSHRGWFAQIGAACRPAGCEGVWVFPAGRPWAEEIR